MTELTTALRALRRTPGFTLAAVATLAIAAGAVNAITAVVSKVLLEPLPVRDQGEIVVAWKKDLASGFEHWPFTYPSAAAIMPQLTTVSATATADYNGAYPLSVVEGDLGLTQMTGIISGTLMPLLGVRPITGRTILPADDVIGAPRVAVISEAFWKSRYSSDPAILTRTFRMQGESYQIVGVVKGFGMPAGSKLWIAVRPFQREITESEDYALANLVVRLKPGITLDQFRAELETVRARTPNEAIEGYKAHRIVAKPLHDFIVAEARPTLLILAGGVALLLIVAAANLGGLFLVRSGSRVHEIAIRSAIGGGAGSLKPLATEFALVVAAGTALGVPAGWAMLRLLGPLLPPELPIEGGVSLQPLTVLLAAAGSALVGLLGGIVPVIALARADLILALRAGGRGAAKGWGMHPIRRVMVVAQMALAVTMVAGAGLLLRTLEQMHRIDPGFQPAGVLFVDLADSRKYDSAVGPKRDEVDRIITRLQAIPGVTSASAGLSPPFVGNAGFYVKYVADGMSKEDAARMPYANTEVVHPALATTVGLRVLRGRFIEPSDGENAPLAIVINEALANTLWPGKDPLGRSVKPSAGTQRATVVGVVADTRYNELLRAAPMAYLSYRQFEWVPGNYLVRAANDAAARALVPQLRQAIREAVPAVAIRTARPLSELMAQPLARPRLAAVLVSGFALIVLVLAAIGIYSVMASFVVQRTREIGVRMALGATGPMVHRLVFGQGMLLALIGVAIGLALAVASSRVLKGMLYGVTPADPVTFGVVSVTLIAVAALAVLVPSIRAARLEPVEALRAD